ncbi:putative dehydrogenase [Methanomicrobium sp. W14]|uniref:Gfo/Idh/MocA family protein n=1 Tax=Methanomicrobium sp. W14 TaxID=2817839 RepID=UPI001AE62330|nr:Gfo/Idh/MocA family oxidoreductase [Methanomicrobium sp. W14]MBP2134436.1 putative dehydrogenase [Methanomicrobium sp. W14]
MDVGIIGCGLIGHKRAASLPQGYLHAVADIDINRAKQLACQYQGVKPYSEWKKMLKESGIDTVIISTTNNWLAPITLEAVRSGINVLVEKPAARNYKEFDEIIQESENKPAKIMVGYNLRCHPSFIKAKKIIESGDLGEIMYIRGRYGHGGRKGYENEWRANPEISGGGELLDQGVHLIDLSRWFLGDFTRVDGYIHTYFWNMPVEDNGFIYLETESGKTAWLHVSCTEWKNLFSYEIFCETGKLQIDGIGGSYGTERLTLYRMLPQMGPPETTIWEYPFPDNSWRTQFEQFEEAVKSGVSLHPDLYDARENLKIVSRIYGEYEI